VLAPAIGIHRAVEADIRTLVIADDAARRVAQQRGEQRRQVSEIGHQGLPAIVERRDLAVEPAGDWAWRAPLRTP
jgi:hypothetical protein